ncbi:hypothetical protein H0176_16960 [Methylorubrum populi]|uniref:Transposase n=1 Tax=Methylorubrum rhodesianum TaxID=29427 RepID=A0ABU9ZBW5_9HYPH|nr:hypothetical protein [Methylorubrum rhodesianum]MBK3401585.1 hypothetical protein [Methylorubrum rhodesianum]MBY0141958.1 hypothetical protein [Methylorubrum populi]
MQQVQTAKERFCPHAPFRKKERARLIPYAGSDRYVRQMTELGSRSRKRSRQRFRLTPEVREWFVAQILAWPEGKETPLTWETLLGKAELHWKKVWSKSGLGNCPEIVEAFAKRTREIGARRSRRPKDPEKAEARRSREQLLAVISRLEAENHQIKTRMRIWQTNAHLHQITVPQLDKGWQPVDREQSDLDLRRKLGLSLPKQERRGPKKRK